MTNLCERKFIISHFALRDCFRELLDELFTNELNVGFGIDHYLSNDNERRIDDILPEIKRMIGHKLANKILSSSTNVTVAFPWSFNEELADIVLGYCTMDDYSYFPDCYIRKKVLFLKKAEKSVA